MKRPYPYALVGAALAGLLVLAPVSVSASAQPLSAGAKPVSSIDKSKPMSATDRAAIDAAAADVLAQSPDKAPGLWLAVWDPKKGYYEQAYGKAILARHARHRRRPLHDRLHHQDRASPLRCCSRWRPGSSKLTDTVAKLDPALAKRFPKAAKYTVAQLLSMTTQIPDYADAAVAIQVADPQHHFTRDELIALGFAKGKPLPKKGGYSTTNYIILGRSCRSSRARHPSGSSTASSGRPE